MVRRGVVSVCAGRAGRGLRLVMVMVMMVKPATLADVIFKVPEVMARPISGSRAVGVGSTNSSRSEPAAAAGGWPEPEPQYEEYFVEHDVSTADARAAAQLLNLDDIPETRVGCGPCSRREMEYCESRVLSDHCCCERQFLPEPFPWLPHTCYVGPHRCRPIARDCTKYARLRDCCCLRRLAERWKSILSSSPGGGSRLSLLVSTLLALLSITSSTSIY
ncbi:uncharacterized protein LOC116773005 isoform X2 [Danaus plexippus]|uniref:uncharacterized protein LOC116773005 isoform X2 n=1 Tax=Danaus plexippus TaxID=13037 RepID=UPI002AB2CA4C|nr:uncharacterized protein LOC116773005 isoform X2 [Danaus plexippus]